MPAGIPGWRNIYMRLVNWTQNVKDFNRKMMRSEREDQEPTPVDNPFTLSISPMNKLKKTSMPESDPGMKKILIGASLEEGEISNHSVEEGEICNQTTIVRIEYLRHNAFYSSNFVLYIS